MSIEHDKDRGKKDLLIMCVLRQLKSMELEELRRVYIMTCGICDGKKKNIELETAASVLPTK